MNNATKDEAVCQAACDAVIHGMGLVGVTYDADGVHYLRLDPDTVRASDDNLLERLSIHARKCADAGMHTTQGVILVALQVIAEQVTLLNSQAHQIQQLTAVAENGTKLAHSV